MAITNIIQKVEQEFPPALKQELDPLASLELSNLSGYVGDNFVTKSNGQFLDRPTLNGTGFLLSGEAAQLPDTIVYTTGTQTISGEKTFSASLYKFSGANVVFVDNTGIVSGEWQFNNRPTVNTVPVALSGEASSNIEQLVKNDSNQTLYKGQPVYVSGSNGNNILIHPASNSGEGTSSKTFGLLKQTLLNNQQGYVVTEGPLFNVDTSMAAEGDPVWLGPTGNLIYGLANKPKAPQHLVSLGFVERAHQNQGKIFVKVQNGFEIEELHDVRIVNKQHSDIIIYNSGSGLWLNSGVNFGNFYTNNNPSGFITSENVVYTSGTQTLSGNLSFEADEYIFSGSFITITGNSILRVDPRTQAKGVVKDMGGASGIQVMTTGAYNVITPLSDVVYILI